MITNYQVGDKVTITNKALRNIINANKSIKAFPSDNFVDICKSLVNVPGKVTKKFPPGYEVNVTFQTGITIQLKDHWIEKIV